MRPNLAAGIGDVEGEEDVRLEAADTLDHQGYDVSVAAVSRHREAAWKRRATTSSGIGIARSAAYMGRPSNGALVLALVNRSAARANTGVST